VRDRARAARLCLVALLRAAPGLTLLSMVLVSAQYAAPPVAAYGVALVVDGVGRSASGLLAQGIALLAAVYAGHHILAGFGEAVSGVLDGHIHGAIHSDLLATTARIPGIAHHEDSDIADRVAVVRGRARDMAGGSWQLVSAVATAVSTATVVILLAHTESFLLVLVPLSTARVWAATAGARPRHIATERSTPWARRAEALAGIAAQARCGLEVRVLGLRARDLRDIEAGSWRSRVSTAFQDFVKFEFTARESVGIGDLDHLVDDRALTAALARAGADTVVGRLPHGLGTQLGTRFEDGVDLSEGQWQRVALARAFMRPGPLLLVLDEPASALDPLAERELANRLIAAGRRRSAGIGAITVVVSHRMSTAQLADLIVLVDRGHAVEVGTHAKLLAAGEVYAYLYASQARALETSAVEEPGVGPAPERGESGADADSKLTDFPR
jgi:ABC-type polar amino acid transport system ATPase subunit